MFPHWHKNPESESDWFDALVGLARYLRSPEGCPWDREQSALSFARFAAEEATEFQEAFDEGDNNHVAEEFGDTFFVMLAAAVAAEEEGRFTLKEALARAHEKMIRRHGHVFGPEKAATAEDAISAWNRIKAVEKGTAGQPEP